MRFNDGVQCGLLIDVQLANSGRDGTKFRPDLNEFDAITGPNGAQAAQL